MAKYKKFLVVGMGVILLAVFINWNSRKPFKIAQSDLGSVEKTREEVSKKLPDNAELIPYFGDDLGYVKYFKALYGAEKAVIHYEKKNSNKPLNIMVLGKDGEYWVEEDRISLVGEEFDKIVFEDINGDGEDEITVGIKIGKNSTKGLSVYGYRDKELVDLYNDNYEELFVADLDSDSVSDIAILKNNSKEKKTEIEYYKYRSDKLELMDSIVLEGSESKVKLDLENVSAGKSGIIAQKETDSKKGFLSVFNIKDGKLERLSLNGKTYIENPIYIKSRDIDGDGIVEFPILKKSFGLSENEETTWITEWNSLNRNGSLNVIKREYTDYKESFAFEMPEIGDGEVGISRFTDVVEGTQNIGFTGYLEDGKAEKLFNIGVYKIEDWRKKSSEYRGEKDIIFKSQSRVYVLESNEGSFELGEIKSRFKLLDFGGD